MTALGAVSRPWGSALAVAARAGRLAAGLGLFGPSAAELERVLPGCADLLGLRQAIGEQRFVNAALRRLSLRGAALAPLLHWHDAEPILNLRRSATPLVVVAWHAGVVAALGAGLQALGCDGVVIRTHAERALAGFEPLVVGRDMASHVAALQRGIAALRAGRVVIVVLEAHPAAAESRHALRFLGRRVHLPAGAEALARLGQARLVPVTTRWEHGRIALTSAAPLPAAPHSMSAIGAWFEAYFRAHPGELWPEQILALDRAVAIPG